MMCKDNTENFIRELACKCTKSTGNHAELRDFIFVLIHTQMFWNSDHLYTNRPWSIFRPNLFKYCFYNDSCLCTSDFYSLIRMLNFMVFIHVARLLNILVIVNFLLMLYRRQIKYSGCTNLIKNGYCTKNVGERSCGPGAA